jgi:hypothetical protein
MLLYALYLYVCLQCFLGTHVFIVLRGTYVITCLIYIIWFIRDSLTRNAQPTSERCTHERILVVYSYYDTTSAFVLARLCFVWCCTYTNRSLGKVYVIRIHTVMHASVLYSART